jgi:hypothetical protein
MAEQDPLRLRILKALTSEFEQIVAFDNGITVETMAGKVFRGRDAFGPHDPLPMISILESVDEKKIEGSSSDMRPGSSLQQSQWELLVQGFVEDDRKNPTDPAYRLLAKVKKRLADLRKVKGNVLGFGPAVTDLQFSAGIVRPADEVSEKAYFWMKVRMNVAEDHSDPYA